MTNAMIENLLKSCDCLARRTVYAGKDYMYSSARCFDACMRAFDRKDGAAESITFRIWLNAPVNMEGRARIHRDGTMEMWTGTEEYAT